MRSTCAFIVTVFAAASVSCTSVRPVKVNTGEQCFRCGRSIGDTRLAGEQISGFVEKFKAPGCMAKYIVKNPSDTGAVFVTDYSSGTMIDVTNAYFVPFVVDDRTGERDYRAYALKADADAAAAALKTTTVDWNVVLDRARTS